MATRYLVTFFSVSEERVVEADDYWVEPPFITFIKHAEDHTTNKLGTFADVCSVTPCGC